MSFKIESLVRHKPPSKDVKRQIAQQKKEDSDWEIVNKKLQRKPKVIRYIDGRRQKTIINR